MTIPEAHFVTKSTALADRIAEAGGVLTIRRRLIQRG